MHRLGNGCTFAASKKEPRTKTKTIMAHSSSNVLAAFIGGAIVGGIAALLLTPKTGKELRDELKELAEREVNRCRCAEGEECTCDKKHGEEEQA